LSKTAREQMAQDNSKFVDSAPIVAILDRRIGAFYVSLSKPPGGFAFSSLSWFQVRQAAGGGEPQ
jgi:hypothetical protein